MAVGDLITATRYNNLQNRIALIMSTGSGNSGYGQTLASSQLSTGTLVTATRVNNLRTDMLKARQHQTGLDESASYPVYTTDNKILEADMLNFETLMTPIETNKLVIGAGQSTVVTGTSSTRTTAWNTRLTHAVTLDFGSASAARYFFNSGGQLRMRATLTAGTVNSINTDWVNMLTNMGTISMNHSATSTTGTGTVQPIGFYGLTSTPVTIFTKSGSGTYTSNSYYVTAAVDVASNTTGTARYVYLTMRFNDDKTGSIDESVTGTLTSYLDYLYATGTNVAVTPPTVTTTTNI